MRVLTDFHHHALAESLELTLGNRLGAKVYFPTGMEYFERDYWAFEKAWAGDAVANQYLVGVWAGKYPASDCDSPTVFWRDDPRHPGRRNMGITLEGALHMPWDIVLSSLPANYDGFYRLAKETGARYGIQIGNDLQAFDTRADFALASSTLPGFGPEWMGRRFEYHGVPTVMYHQEFDLETFRHDWPPFERKSVGSFIQCFAENPVPYAEFLEIARQSPDLDWRVYGAYGTHPVDEFAAGNLDTTPAVADRMRATRIIWHSKSWSDGFGHVIHNAFAIGRPVVGRQSYYADKLAGPLWVDGVTSFDIDRYSRSELVGILRRLRDDDDYHHDVSDAAAARFREVVDYDAEAELIGDLLGVAVPA